MASPIQMVQQSTGAMKMAYHGFSWTTLFFGPFPALFRGHFLGFLLILIADLITVGLANFIFIFTYNGWHKNWLMGKGYIPAVGLGIMGAGINNTNQNSVSTNVAPTINVHVGDIAAAVAAAQRSAENSSNNPPTQQQGSIENQIKN